MLSDIKEVEIKFIMHSDYINKHKTKRDKNVKSLPSVAWWGGFGTSRVHIHCL